MDSKELQLLQATTVMPVVVLERSDQALPLAEALLRGGIEVMEITLRSDVGLDAIELVAKQLPEVMVGAGTVVSVDQMRAVKDRGARFVISPGISEALLKENQSTDIPYIPGVATASDVMMGLSHGKQCFKLFPADAVGGIKLLKALSGPFPDVKFCPTGGISESNMKNYLQLKNVLCVGGSWLCSLEMLRGKKWGEVEVLAKAALALGSEI